jgi:hypothetical protein
MDIHDQSCQACVVQMSHYFHEDSIGCTTIAFAKSNMCLLIDVKTCWGWMPFTTPRGNPLFDQIFLELYDVFVYDFIATIKMCEGNP